MQAAEKSLNDGPECKITALLHTGGLAVACLLCVYSWGSTVAATDLLFFEFTQKKHNQGSKLQTRTQSHRLLASLLLVSSHALNQVQ